MFKSVFVVFIDEDTEVYKVNYNSQWKNYKKN